jgi:putative salt-induced outer membrane protein YdiY
MKSYKSALVIMTILAGAMLSQATTSRAQAVTAQGQGTNAPDSDVVKDWHGHVGAGASLSKGNANTVLLTLQGRAEKDWKNDEWSLGADYKYGLNNWGKQNQAAGQNQTVAASSITAFGDYKRLITDRFYASLHLEGDHDDSAALRYRVTVGPAVGYYLIKSDVTRFNFDVGPSYVREQLGDNPPAPGHNNTDSYIALRLAERCEHDLSKTAKIWEGVEYLAQVDKFSNYLLNSEAGISAALNAHFSLSLIADDHYNSKPAASKQSNDFTLVAALNWTFGPQ